MVADLHESSGNKRKLPSWQSSNYRQNLSNEDDKMESGEDIDRASASKELESNKEAASKIRSVSSANKGTGEDSVAKAKRMSGDGQASRCVDGSHNQHPSPKGRQLDPESSKKPMRKTPLKTTRKNLEDDTGDKVATASSQRKPPLEKFLDGVIFALSGLVNPERANIREIAIQMGAHYRPDWTADCTLLVCAFANTPKFNQVKNDNGTIVSKAWILDCYKQKELLEIDRYLMHAGKPWRNVSISVFNDANGSTSGQKRSKCSNRSEEPRSTIASLSEIKQWVHTDVASSIAWLQKHESHPKEEEMKLIAIQGVELCLEDAIECLKNKQSVESILETWDFLPRAVRELVDRERQAKDRGNVGDLLSEAERLKWIYASELKKLIGEEESSNPKEEEEDDESTDKMTETSDTESDDGTQTLSEADIIEAKAKIKKMLAEKKV